MNNIKWKYSAKTNIWTGFINNEEAFFICGTYCVMDRRNKPFELPKYYKIISVQNGKDIAKDLLLNRNIELHETNRLAWIEEQNKTANLIIDTRKMIDELNKEK